MKTLLTIAALLVLAACTEPQPVPAGPVIPCNRPDHDCTPHHAQPK